MGDFSARTVIFSLAFALSACSLLGRQITSPRPITSMSPPGADTHLPTHRGCLELLDQYCDSLYSPGTEGNLIIHQHKGTPIYVLQGKTANGLHHVFYELSRSKIRNRDFLPKDFLSVLKAHHYFDRLEALIHRDPIESMNLMNRLEATEIEFEVDHLWNIALKDTLIMRLTQRFPEFPRTPVDLQSPEIGHFERMERKILLSEISKAIWRDHPNWTKVTHTFEKLRKKYAQLIETLPIPDSLKTQWKARIGSILLVLPGSMPEIVDQDCSSTNINAFYYTNYNVMTVCAGDFNSEDILMTLSHEMAHALDNDRSLYLFYKTSALSQKLERFAQRLCSIPAKTISCDDWQTFKHETEEDLETLSEFKPALPELQRCLKKDPSQRPLDPDTIHRFAESAVREKMRVLADEEAFIRVTQGKLPLPNGKRVTNPSYLNPCYYLQSSWSNENLNGELPILTAFISEYQCSQEKIPAERLRKSMEFTNRLFEEIEAQMILSEGEFSERKALIDEDYSSPSSERFADYLGSLVVAEYLKDIQALWDRRMTFLAGNSWQCNGPSLSKSFPKEAEVLRKYLLDTHTDGEDRKKEVFSLPIRKALQCDQDFQWKECSFFNSPGTL